MSAIATPAPGSPAPSASRRLTREGGMTLNALSLATATVLTNLLGLAFWAVASHLHAAADVGRASAAVSALILLATIAQLNLPNVFLRFLPAAGARAERFVARSHLVVFALALIVGLVYVVSGLGSAVLSRGLPEQAVFVVSVALCAIFALQDGALTALRLAWWVPIENTSFALAKLLLLPALVFVPAGFGIVVAWMAPVAIAVIVVNWLLFRRVLPATDATAPGHLPARGRLASFIAAEYSATLCSTAAMQAMPLLVLWQLGAVANAYFTLPWLIWMAIMVLLGNVMATFVVEAVAAPGNVRAGLRKGALLGAAMIAAILVCCTLAAPLFLRLAGAEYADHGAALLRLIGLSAPFTAVVVVYTGFAWLDQRVWRLAGIQAVTGTLLVVLTLVLLPRIGLVGVGWANLIAQAVTAAAMTPFLWRRISSLRRAAKPAALVPAGSGMGVDPVLAAGPDGRRHGSLSELAGDARHAADWSRRGRLVTSPYVPQALRRRLLALGGMTLGHGVSGMERCWFESGAVSLGAGTYVNAGCWFEGQGRIDVGAHCLLGPEVLLLTSTHRRGPRGVAREASYDPVAIGDRCWIGARAIVLAGVTIGDDVVIAAGAVVTRDCEPGHLYGGVPARRIR